MAIVDQKKKVFGNIAALRTLTEGFPKLKTSFSFPSINNNGNPITFLTDLIKSLIGYEALVKSVVDILSHSLPDIEHEIKVVLKQELKSIVSCGVDPSIPAFIKSTGTGINIEVNKIDFTDMMLIDPNSVGGKLMYNDITSPLVNSTDFNTFLFGTIQDDGISHDWGSNTSVGNDVISVKFVSLGTGSIPNNTITINANPTYDSAPKTLTDLNNDYIDSLVLFNPENIINNVVDSIFGSISVSVNKTSKQLESEAKVNNVIDCIVNADDDDIIDDSFFTFTNDEVYVHEETANFRKSGIKKLECCNKVAASIPVTFLTSFNNEIATATTVGQKSEIISKNLDKMATQTTANSPNPVDHISIKLNFVQEILNNLTKSIINIVISPKIILIFLVNFKIINGPTADFTDSVEFIKYNKTLLKAMMKKIAAMIIKKLLAIALKKIAEIVAAGAVKQQIEKAKANLAQLLSLVGIPQEVLRQIQGLIK